MGKKEKIEARVNMRVKPSQLKEIKEIATRKGIPYQTLIRSWIAEGIWKEREFEKSFHQKMFDNCHDV